MNFEEIAQGTVQVVCGAAAGSGFHLLDPKLIVTNQHVLDAGKGAEIVVSTEAGDSSKAKVILSSPAAKYDFAVLELSKNLAGKRTVFQPGAGTPDRGTDVAFAGFPHGITDLLVQRACVAGPFGTLGFHIDGSVNGGNSGGPVVRLEDSLVVGIVTQRRFFFDKELRELAKQSADLTEHVNIIRMSGGSAVMLGVNFAELVGAVAAAFDLLVQTMQWNAGVGIGMAYGMDWVIDECRAAGLS